MIDIVLKKDKTIRRTKHEDIYEGENKISWINVYLPETINDIDIKDYNIVLRCYINADNYIPYTLDTTKSINKIDITHEFTDKDRYIDAYLYITRADEVIGKTNTVSFRVNKAKDGSGLTPREQFDERIAELENENEGLEREVEEKDETITQQTEQITELSGEVTELETENTRLENQHRIDLETIDSLNHRVPPLQTLDPINPSQTQQTFNPESPNIGFPQVVVNAPTAEGLGFDFANLKKDVEFLGGVGTYDPFPEHSVGGIYITEVDEDFNRPKKVLVKGNFFSSPFNAMQFSYEDLVECIFEAPTIRSLNPNCFYNCRRLKKVILPQNLTDLNGYIFYGDSKLKEVFLPGTLSAAINNTAFQSCSQLEFVTIGNGFNANGLKLSSSTLYSVETIVSWFEALADRTGETAYTLTIGTTNLNKMTAEEKAIATNKNWNLA